MTAKDEPVRIRVRINCLFAVNARYSTTFDGPLQSEWDAMTADERSDYFADCEDAEVANQIEAIAEVVENGR